MLSAVLVDAKLRRPFFFFHHGAFLYYTIINIYFLVEYYAIEYTSLFFLIISKFRVQMYLNVTENKLVKV